jgi:2-amino-4-hydroxy-6-hydroxymethyldihydropteridine diphosphokinase
MSSATTSRSISSVVVALGSNLGDRALNLRRAVHALQQVMSVVRVSPIIETKPVDAPPPDFLNMAVSGWTYLSPHELLSSLMEIETRLGRLRRGVGNAPRTIDLDLILHGGHRVRTRALTLPHPRAREREFVMLPLRTILSVSVIPSVVEGPGRVAERISPPRIPGPSTTFGMTIG